MFIENKYNIGDSVYVIEQGSDDYFTLENRCIIFSVSVQIEDYTEEKKIWYGVRNENCENFYEEWFEECFVSKTFKQSEKQCNKLNKELLKNN